MRQWIIGSILLAAGVVSAGFVHAMQQTQVTFTLVASYTGELVSVTGSYITTDVGGALWTASSGALLDFSTQTGVSYELIHQESTAVIASGTTIDDGGEVFSVSFPTSGIYSYVVRMTKDGQPATTETVVFSVDQDPPADVTGIVIEETQDVTTQESAIRFRRPAATDSHTQIDHYVLRLYDAQGDLVQVVYLPQRELYLATTIFTPDEQYAVSVTAVDVMGNESTGQLQYFTYTPAPQTTGSSVSGPSGSPRDATNTANQTDSGADSESDVAVDDEDTSTGVTDDIVNNGSPNDANDSESPQTENDQDTSAAPVDEPSNSGQSPSPQESTTNQPTIDVPTVIDSALPGSNNLPENTTNPGVENRGIRSSKVTIDWYEGHNYSYDHAAVVTSSQRNRVPTVIDLRQTESSTPVLVDGNGRYRYHASAPAITKATMITSSSVPEKERCWWMLVVLCVEGALMVWMWWLLISILVASPQKVIKNLTDEK